MNVEDIDRTEWASGSVLIIAFSWQPEPDARTGHARPQGRLREAGRETLTEMSRTGNDSLPPPPQDIGARLCRL